MDVDTALAKVGGYRRWHLAIFSFLGIFGFMPLCWHGIIIVFLGIPYDHHCTPPEGHAVSNRTIPWVSGENKGHWHQCQMYSNYSINNDTTECKSGWTYDKEPREESIVSEWDLVCNKDYMSDLSQTLYQVGALIGEMFCGVIVDKYGRRKIFIAGTFLCALCGSIVSLSPNYIVFCILRAVTAFAVLGQCWAAETLMMEIFDSKRRAFAGIGLEGLWVIDYVILGGLAYFLRNWRHLQLVISLMVLPGMIAIWILPESPMWLVANGRVEEAEKVLQDMARWNGVKAPARLLQSSDAEEHLMSETNNTTDRETKKSREAEEDAELPLYSWTTLFTDPTMRLQTIVSSTLWFGNSVVYYAMILASPSLPGSIYLTFTLGALIEIPAYIITYFIVIYWGRRIPTVVFHILAGIVLAAISFIPSETADGTSLSWLIVTMAMLGKFAITISFAIIILYTKEIFPTNLRATSGGVCSVPARLGTMAAPFASYAAKRIPWLPNIILGALSFIAAAVTLILPETKGAPLPQTIEDVELMYVDHKVLSCRSQTGKAMVNGTKTTKSNAKMDRNSNGQSI